MAVTVYKAEQLNLPETDFCYKKARNVKRSSLNLV